MAYRLGNPYTVALLVAAAVTFGLAATTLGHRRERAGRAFFGFLVGIGLWSLADGMRYAAPTASSVLLWNRVGYLGIVTIPPTLLLFVLAYTGRERWFRRRYLAALFLVSAAAYAVVLTNPHHGLWFEVVSLSPGTAPPVLQERWGLAWYAWAVYSYAVVFAVVYLMGREFLVANRSGTHRGQTGMVLAGIAVAAVVNALFIFDFVAFDPAPFVFAVTGLFFAAAVFRYQLLTLLPVARDTVVRNMDSGVLVLDGDDRLVDANERARSTFGIEDPEAFGAPLDRALADYPTVRERLAGDASEDPVPVETDGEVRHYDLEVSALSDALDTHVGRVAVFTDITRRVDQQRRLRERTEELERTNERLDEFASVVSHDLRNPLSVVSGRLDLARGATAEERERHLAAAEDATARMEEMVEDLLTLARQGQSVGETEQVRLDVVAEEAWAHVDAGAATLSCETTATVAADPDRLREALGNLFRNSVEHGATGSRPEAGDSVEHGSTSNRSAPRSGDIAGRESAGSQDAERSGDSVEYGATGSRPRVDDGASPTGDGGEGREDDRVHVRVGSLPDGFFVEDDGPGIPPSERDRVFEAGYTTAPDGTGFGLNIVRTVVRAHGWDVEATEGRDGGARFEVTGVDVG